MRRDIENEREVGETWRERKRWERHGERERGGRDMEREKEVGETWRERQRGGRDMEREREDTCTFYPENMAWGIVALYSAVKSHT